LHQQSQIEGGFGSPLIVEQVTEIAPSLRKCRIDPDCRVQCCLGFDIAWTKSADQILASVKRFCHKAQQTLCGEL
jgi:hypothetical protein